ncbi:nitroreductase family protein [Rossellomorea aquimaris]|nr:nitroreductase family protein [Rossellomorea aquimaris]
MSFKKFIPKPIRRIALRMLNHIQLLNYYFKDMNRYSKHSFDFSNSKAKRHHETDLIYYYHKIEKGLSLPNPRIGFGQKVVNHLLSILNHYIKQYGWDNVSIAALNTLYSYYYFNEKNDLRLNELLNKLEELSKTIDAISRPTVGGIDEVKKVDIDKSNIDFKEFAFSRYSIRNYAPGNVSIDLIKEAVYIAQKTPSVCNRQPWRVYVYSNEEDKINILKYQNGNVGFGDGASKILIVTSELKDFRGPRERNQSYIDGGMYSMSLIYALHSLGVGSCALNLAVSPQTETELKNTANISESEVLIMMIAVGNLPKKLNVASSPRRAVEDVIAIN